MAKSNWIGVLLLLFGCSRPEPAGGQSAKDQPSASAAPSNPFAAPLPSTATTAASNAIAAPQRCEILAVGDSLTDRRSGGGGYLEAAQRCGCRVTNLGKGGDMVNQMRVRLAAHLAAPHPTYSHVIVFGGVNDLYSDLTAKRSVEKIEADLASMYRAAQSNHAKVIAITVTPWGGFRRYFTEHRWQNTRRLNDWIRETRNGNLTDALVDGEVLLSCGEATQLCESYAAPYRDGLHFGPLGHRTLAAALVRAIGPDQCGAPPDAGSDQG